MAVEFSAFTAIVAPDDKTLEYVKDRPYGPRGGAWSAATAHWNTLFSKPDAHFERELEFDCSVIQACVTWGTSPQHLVVLGGRLPAPELEPAPDPVRFLVLSPPIGSILVTVAPRSANMTPVTGPMTK